MNSKEALELLYRNCPMTVVRENDGIYLYSEYLVEVIKQDLDRLEMLEKENSKLKKVIDILKRFVTISYCRNEETNKWDIPIMYYFGFSEKITQEEYDLLKGVFMK